MHPTRLAKAFAMAAALVALTGCVTSGGKHALSVNTLEGTYQAPRSNSLPNDIKEILTAGGLDLADPSAPGDDTEIAEMATNASRGRKEVDTLVAKLEADAPSPAPASPNSQVLAMASEKPPAAAAAFDINPEPETVTIRYPDIGIAAAEPAKAVVAAAMAPKEPRRRAAAVLPAPRPQPTKRRF